MKTLKFKNEFETSEMVVRLQMASAKFKVSGRRELLVEDEEPALVLPPTFVAMLKEEIAQEGYQLTGASKHKSTYKLFVSGVTIELTGSFSLSDVMRKIRILC